MKGRQENKELRKAKTAEINRTLDSLTFLDENIMLLDYQSDYDLQGVLESGKTSIVSLVRLFRRKMLAPKLAPNPARGHGGCSTFNVKSPDGEVLMGRNFDFKPAKCLVVWTHPENGYKSVAVCDREMMLYGDLRKVRRPLRLAAAPYLSMDGINEKGLCAAVLELATKMTKQETGKPPITVIVALRAILDTCATVEEAIRLLEKYDMHDLLGACYHYQFTDAEGTSAIVEYVDNKMYVIRQEVPGESLKLTNFFLTPGGHSREMGRDRFEIVSCALQEKPVMTEQEAMDALEKAQACFRSRYKLWMIKTLWSAVYNCTEKTMLLCAGMDYSRKYKLSVSEPLKVVTIE